MYDNTEIVSCDKTTTIMAVKNAPKGIIFSLVNSLHHIQDTFEKHCIRKADALKLPSHQSKLCGHIKLLHSKSIADLKLHISK